MKYFVLLLLLPSLVTAQYQDAISTKDVQDCMDNECKKVRRRPHPCYQESLKRLKLEQAHLLKTAPRAWLTYRDAQGEADYKMSVGATRRSSRPH